MVAFKNEVEAKTDGKIKVEIITDLKLGSAKDVLDAVQLGTVQMAVNTAAYTQNLIPQHGIFNLPYLFKDRASKDGTLDAGTTQRLRASGKTRKKPSKAKPKTN